MRFGPVRRGTLGVACFGKVGHGLVWLVKAWRGNHDAARCGEVWHGHVRRGSAGRGNRGAVGHGSVRHGAAWLGKVRFGWARESWFGVVGRGLVGWGVARQGQHKSKSKNTFQKGEKYVICDAVIRIESSLS